jgi:hypothetical protein
MQDKRIVIIGGTSGMGLAIAKAAAGAQVTAAALMDFQIYPFGFCLRRISSLMCLLLARKSSNYLH